MKLRTPTVITRGFTIIELVVVLAIIALLSTLVFANHAKFGSVIMLENLAYESAFAVRKAQVYGISVFGTGGTYAPGYGVHFEAATPSTFIIFPDNNNDGLYDAGETPLETESLRTGYSLSALCVTPSSGAESCGRTKIDIVFKRPEPGAYIYADGNALTQYARARVELKSPRYDKKNVIIEVSGQITVQ